MKPQNALKSKLSLVSSRSHSLMDILHTLLNAASLPSFLALCAESRSDAGHQLPATFVSFSSKIQIPSPLMLIPYFLLTKLKPMWCSGLPPCPSSHRMGSSCCVHTALCEAPDTNFPVLGREEECPECHPTPWRTGTSLSCSYRAICILFSCIFTTCPVYLHK